MGSVGIGPDLLLDTCVYIDVLQRRMPPDVKDLLRRRILNHSSVALSELTHAFGRLAPKRSDTPRTLVALETAISEILPRRLTCPSASVFGEAGMLAGMAARMFGRARGMDLLNDALLLQHAGATGRALLTRNVRDFDLLQQLAPWTRFLAYR
jgi:predicted nucleic acid-binding protein